METLSLLYLVIDCKLTSRLLTFWYGMNLGTEWQRIPKASSTSDSNHCLQFHPANTLYNMTDVHNRKRGKYKLLFYPGNRPKQGCDTLLSVQLDWEIVLRTRGYIWSQLHMGNTLYNEVFCLGNTLTEREKERAREKYISIDFSSPRGQHALWYNTHYKGSISLGQHT